MLDFWQFLGNIKNIYAMLILFISSSNDPSYTRMTDKIKTDSKRNSDLNLKNEMKLKVFGQKFQLHSNVNWTLIATLLF